MERKNTLLLTVIAIATLLVAVVGATFAYFATTVNTDSNGLNVTANTEAATAVFLASGTDLSLEVLGTTMQRAGSQPNNYVLANSSNTTLEVTYGAAASGDAAYSCTYDIVFKWTSAGDNYLYSEQETKPTAGWATFGREFTLAVGTATVTGWTDTQEKTTTVAGMAERNIAFDGSCADSLGEAVAGADTYEACKAADETNVWTEEEVMTLVHGASIHSNTGITPAHCDVEGYDTAADCTENSGHWVPAAGGTVVSWPIDIAFYNLPLDQTALSGKSFTGRVEVANVVC